MNRQDSTDLLNSPGRRFAESVLWLIAAWAYWPVLWTVVDSWSSDPDYSHGYLVIPISAWLLWVRRAELPTASKQIDWRALGLFAIAGAMRYVAGRLYLPQIDAWSIPIWIAAIVWMFHGFRRVAWAAPAIAFLWFATPLPDRTAEVVSLPLQQLAASLSASALQLLGQPAIANGTTILLGDEVLDVERACSGLRMFYGILALASACVAALRPRLWKSIIILAATAPIAIVANVARIVVTGLLMQYISGETAAKFSHDFAGLAMIPLAASLLLLLYWFLLRTEQRFVSGKRSGYSWLVAWTASLLVLGVVVLICARIQQEKAYVTLLETARRFEQSGDAVQAVRFLNQYTTVRPDDTDALIHLADAINKFSGHRGDRLRAIEVYRNAWQRRPDRTDLAISAIEISRSIGEYRTAIEVSRQAIAADEGQDHATLDRFRKSHADALIDYLHWEGGSADFTWQDAVAALRDAVSKSQKYEIRHALELARLLRQYREPVDSEESVNEAESIIDQVVTDCPRDPLAWLARYQFRRESGSEVAVTPSELKQDLLKAIELARTADNQRAVWEVYLEAARDYRQHKDLEGCRDNLNQAISAAPERPLAYALLADVERDSLQPDSLARAEQVLRKGLNKAQTDQLTLLFPLAFILAEQERFDEAEQQVEVLERIMPLLANSQRAIVRFTTVLVRAQIEASRGNTHTAIQQLADLVSSSDAQVTLKVEPRMLTQSLAFLAGLYHKAGYYDQAFSSLLQAVRTSSDQSKWRRQIALYAQQAGELEFAQSQYRELAAEQPAVAWLALAKIAIQDQLARKRSDRNWREPLADLERARAAGATEDSLAIVRAEILAAQEDFAAARKVLLSAQANSPENASLLRSLAIVDNRLSNRDQSIAWAEKYIEASNHSSSATILYARLLEDVGRSDKALAVLESYHSSRAKDDDDVALALAQLLFRRNESKQAIDGLKTYLSDHPKSSHVAEFLASWAMLNRDWPMLEEYEHWLADKVEGDRGTVWRAYRIQRLLGQVSDRNDPQFEEAVTLSEELVRLRPQWSKTYSAIGELELLRGNLESALVAFERAWRLGERGIAVTDRLVDLSSRLGRFQEAQHYVEQASSYLAISPQFFDRALPYYARSDERQEALRVADSWVQQRPDDPESHLRLGRVFLILGEASENRPTAEKYFRQAEAAFQQAIRLEPNNVQPWVACVLFYARGESTVDKAVDVLTKFAEQVSIEPLQREFVLGQLYEILQKPEQAEFHYTRALEELPGKLVAPQQSNLICRIALFYNERSPWVAEQLARQALALQPQSELAARVLLRTLALRKDTAAQEEGLIIARSQSLAPRDPADRRAIAMTLGKSDRPEELAGAIDLLDTSLQKSADDKVVLARLYEKSGRVGAAYDLLEDLVTRPIPRTGDLIEYLRFWQDHFISADAKEETAFGDRARGVYSSLLSNLGSEDEWLKWKIRERQRRDGGKKPPADKVLSDIQNIWGTLRSQNHPDDTWETCFLRVLIVLLQEDLPDAAVRLVENPPRSVSANRAEICLAQALVLADNVDAQQSPQIVEFYRRKQSAPATSLSVLLAIGDSQFMNRQFLDAVQSYQQILNREPENPSALNNLALALSELEGQQSEARKICQAALQLHPNDSDLIDTLAVVEMLGGNYAKAGKLLDSLSLHHDCDPVVYLHKSAVLQLSGREADARRVFAVAMARGLSRCLLSPRDRDYMKKMLDSRSTVATYSMSEFGQTHPSRR